MKYNKYDKQEWVIEYLREHKEGVDILNQDFVDKYIEKFNPKYAVQPYGANTCKQLNRLLSDMYHCNMLNRWVVGLSGIGMGFPKWVYVYTLKIFANKL